MYLILITFNLDRHMQLVATVLYSKGTAHGRYLLWSREGKTNQPTNQQTEKGFPYVREDKIHILRQIVWHNATQDVVTI